MFALSIPALLALLVAAPPQNAKTAAGGVFLGRSGKPIARARLLLATVTGDAEFRHANVKLLSGVAAAVTDEKGRFTFRGFTPGTYTIIYLLPGSDAVFPVQFGIKALGGETQSLLPLMRGVEFGRGENYPERAWGRQFFLLKGHTFYGNGPNMKVWNATARRGPRGPCLEVRKGDLWLERFDNNTQVKFEAWSH
jgi:hypothetical protein